MEDRALYLLALSLTKGLGPVSVKNLISYCGSAKAVFNTPKGKLLRTPGVGEQTALLVQRAETLKRAELEVAYCEKHGIRLLTYLDDAYPHALKYIHDAPLILFQKGNIDPNAQVNIAIVGTRKATDYGTEQAQRFADFFAQRGINVVSGLAYGIDIAAHRAALDAGGRTTAVLAHGLDTIYPGRHARRARQMLEQGGLLTEYLTGTKPDAPHFPARNRIISGICKAVIVIEAAEKGGALITARQAFDQSRQVYALPGRIGDPYSAGCNALIRQDIARLVNSPEEVLDDLDIQWQQHDDQSEQLELALQAPSQPLSAEEAQVLNCLAQGEVIIDHIALKTGIPMHRLNSLLLSMEFKALLRQMPGKKYRRC
ncbi:MAG: DNA-protecting protein DprA [Bacteroidetes bacterium]|nr:MAG: DNA-protecting protein DprA [Bacteroidota bacterium]